MSRAFRIVVWTLVVAGATACAPLNSAPRDAGAGDAGGNTSTLDGGVGLDAGGGGGGSTTGSTGGHGIGGGEGAGKDGASAGGTPGAGGHAIATGGVPGAAGSLGSAGRGATAGGGRGGSGGAVGAGGSPGTGSGGMGTGGAPMCVTPGLTCAMSTDCCQTGDTAPTGAVCLIDDNLCHAKCTNGSQCKSGCCAALTGQTYGACAAASFCPTLKGVGDPCAANAECATGLCSGWCRADCDVSNDLCLATSSSPTNSQGYVNWCVQLTTSGYSCFPGCIVTSDCAPYGTGLTCKSANVVDGTTEYVCSQ